LTNQFNIVKFGMSWNSNGNNGFGGSGFGSSNSFDFNSNSNTNSSFIGGGLNSSVFFIFIFRLVENLVSGIIIQQKVQICLGEVVWEILL
jgi:hypothetical protein